MGFGKLLTRPSAPVAAEARVAGAGFQVIIDGTPVNFPTQFYRGGMGIPGAWRAALMITDLLGSVPWDAFREDANGMPVDKITPRPPLLAQPAPPDNSMTTFSSFGLDLVWHGNAVGIIAALDDDGIPAAVLPIPAEQVGVRRVGSEAVSALPVGAIEYNIAGFSYAPWEVIHVKGPCPPSEIRGFGVLEAHLNGAGALDLAQDLAKQANSISQHGVPTGTLKSTAPDLTEAEADTAKARWLAAQANRSIAVLNATTEFQPLSWNPDELQLVEARKMSLLEIALIFGVQPSALGVETSNRTYRNDNAEDVKFTKWGLRGHIARFERTLSAAFPPGLCVVADLDDYIRPDPLTRAQTDQIRIASRVLLPNEARVGEGKAPILGGDEFPAPVAVATDNDAPKEDTDDRQDDGQDDGQ